MDEDLNKVPAYTLQSSSEALLSIQRLDFKTSFLEALEELRMRRNAEVYYEEQISKSVVERQELEWQKEALEHQKEALIKQHKEALATFKKQFQERIFAMEEEKGRYLLAEEAKEREREGLKETLKTLQISKHSLQKKLHEMEQKLQLYILAKEDHQKSLSEVEKYNAVITSQFEIIKETHERLEQNVVEAIQLNKKLTAKNKRQEFEIDNLKKELKKVAADLIRSNVTSEKRVGEENLNLSAKEQELEELQQKYAMETELTTKISEENVQLKEEKEEIIGSLQHMQQLLCRQAEINVKMEMKLNVLKEENQTLERDNELQREKAKENEEKFLNLQNEYEKAQATWENEVKNVSNENELDPCKKENKYTQTSDYYDIEQELEAKNTSTSSLDCDEMQTEQNNEDIYIGEVNSIGGEDINCLKKCVTEYMTHPCKENQKGASTNKAICTVSCIAPELTSELWADETEETRAKGTVHKDILDKINAREEIKPPDNCYSLVQFPVEKPKVFLESIEMFDCPNTETDQQTKLNEHIERSVENEFVSKINEKFNNIPHVGSSTKNEALCEDDSTSEKTTNNQPNMDMNCIFSLHTVESNPITFSDNSLIPSNENENTNNLPISRNLNLSTEIPSNGINETPCKQSDEDNSRLTQMNANKPECTHAALALNTEMYYESQSVDLMKTKEDTRDQQTECCTFRTTDKQFLVVQDKEREEPLSSTTARYKNKERNTKIPCFLSIKPSGDLVSRYGKPSFELLAMEKKQEKTSEFSNLARVYQDESQMVSPSVSTMPVLLKEKLFSKELKSTNSKNIGQNTALNIGIREETLASTPINRVADTLNTGSSNPGPKRNPNEEWNAIEKAFYDPSFPTEHVKEECPQGLTQRFSQLASEVKVTVSSDNSQSREDWNLQNTFIKTRIHNIEKFLYLERICQPRKRKYEEEPKRAMATDKVEM